MNRITLLSACVLLGACASKAEIPEHRTDRSIVSMQTNDGSMEVQLTRDAAISTDVISADMEAVWQSLPEVYETLAIEVTGVDPNSRMLTSTSRARRVGGKSMATYFNCPGPYSNLATSGDVYMTVRTQVLPGSGEMATVRHEIAAVARSSTGSISQVRCISKGALEKLLTKTIQEQLASGAA